MARSGSTDYSINRGDIIKYAYQNIGVLASGESPTAAQTSDATDIFNYMIKEWMATGYNIWATALIHVFLDTSSKSYQLGTSGDRACFDTDLIETEMRVAGVATDTILEVDSTTGMAASDVIGVELDDGTVHWTTISSVTDSDTLVIASGLASAAAVDNNIWTYTSLISRPLRIDHALRRDTSGTDIPLIQVSRQEYLDLPTKSSTGRVNEIYYDAQLDNGNLYVWPVSDSATDHLVLSVQRTLEDMDSTANEPDFPIEWGQALIWGLSEQLGVNNLVSAEVLTRARQEAARSMSRVASFDRETTSIYIQPEMR